MAALLQVHSKTYGEWERGLTDPAIRQRRRLVAVLGYLPNLDAALAAFAQ